VLRLSPHDDPVSDMVAGGANIVREAPVPLWDKGRQVHDRLLDVASGRRSPSEELALGGEQIVPWRLGAVL